jgi:hypothetical protein
MKSDPLVGTLVGVLVLFVLASVALDFLYVKDSRELRSLSTQVAAINSRRAGINMVANEAVKFSEKDPSIDPILISAGLKPGQPAPATAGKTLGK